MEMPISLRPLDVKSKRGVSICAKTVLIWKIVVKHPYELTAPKENEMKIPYNFPALALLVVSPLGADMLEDANRMLCVPGDVSYCAADIGCKTELPEDKNIPEFIEVDLKRKTLATTKASGEGRSTPIGSQQRQDGHIYLQGVENGRTFSMVISETTGNLTFAIATDGETATGFGDCTPD